MAILSHRHRAERLLISIDGPAIGNAGGGMKIMFAFHTSGNSKILWMDASTEAAEIQPHEKPAGHSRAEIADHAQAEPRSARKPAVLPISPLQRVPCRPIAMEDDRHDYRHELHCVIRWTATDPSTADLHGFASCDRTTIPATLPKRECSRNVPGFEQQTQHARGPLHEKISPEIRLSV